MANEQPRFREILDPEDAAIAAAHELVRQSFHKAESVARHEWWDSLREREAGLWADIQWHLIIAELQGTVIGVASGTYLGNVNTGVIGYLAVSESARGHGVGPKLRTMLRSLFNRDAKRIRGQPLDAIIGEVRRENPWLRTLVRREQVLALNLPYFQPTLHSGHRPVPLVLYYESLTRVRKRLSVVLVRQLLFTTWRRVYRIARPMDDAAFRRTLAGMEGRRFISGLRQEDLPPLATLSAGS